MGAGMAMTVYTHPACQRHFFPRQCPISIHTDGQDFVNSSFPVDAANPQEEQILFLYLPFHPDSLFTQIGWRDPHTWYMLCIAHGSFNEPACLALRAHL
jgi:hypothetical protein